MYRRTAGLVAGATFLVGGCAISNNYEAEKATVGACDSAVTEAYEQGSDAKVLTSGDADKLKKTVGIKLFELFKRTEASNGAINIGHVDDKVLGQSAGGYGQSPELTVETSADADAADQLVLHYSFTNMEDHKRTIVFNIDGDSAVLALGNVVCSSDNGLVATKLVTTVDSYMDQTKALVQG